ncbi:MAG: Rpn family recombination-promoting nuclease/putative transposase [Candidatus Electrothrix aestuarii]|uniref:Rpn family recombination-promoting nuclease/putative transposase n=1 Tax=Candidatus Electrothrix aestuarii TaxID=3062594 RepID=A0AAU8LQP2_9BACT|nr:Rpn family recombination-promoting nuclease/putative transposase [Candidatus Electrothrix aestuarii]
MSQRKLIGFDWAMKKLLRSKANFEILEGFLSELLMEDICILELLESESNKEEARDKFNRVDLKVKNEKKEIIIIEVQYEREFDYLQRILFATSKVITEHLQESSPYLKVTKVISINILYFDLGHGDDYVYHGTTSFRGLHEQDLLQLSDEQQELYGKDRLYEVFPEYYLIKVNKFNDIAKDTLDEWIYFLKNEEIKSDFKAKGIKKAKQELDILKLSDEERRAYERYQDDLHYQASMVESTYTAGVNKGRKQRDIEIARELLAVGQLDVQTIAQVTGLTMKEVEILRQE